MDRLRVAVVGLGRFGDIHARLWAQIPQAELVAVCSRSEERAREVAAAYGATRWYTDIQNLVQATDIDAIDICSNLPDHAPTAIAALEHGKHVLCEILFTLSLEETGRCLELAQHHGLACMIGFIERFDVRRADAQRRVARGELGQLVSLYVRRNVWRGFLDVPRDKPYPLILQPGILSIDQLLWMAGEPVREVYARSRALVEPHHADSWWAMLTFASGLVGVIEQSWFMPDRRLFWCDVHFEAVGTQASLHISEPSDAAWVWTPEATMAPDFFLLPEVHGRSVGALVDQLTYFADCLNRGETPVQGSLSDHRAALLVGQAILESAARNQIIKL
jgi:UDP-N-acetylglucosamine 3-dehydrogenase